MSILPLSSKQFLLNWISWTHTKLTIFSTKWNRRETLYEKKFYVILVWIFEFHFARNFIPSFKWQLQKKSTSREIMFRLPWWKWRAPMTRNACCYRWHVKEHKVALQNKDSRKIIERRYVINCCICYGWHIFYNVHTKKAREQYAVWFIMMFLCIYLGVWYRVASLIYDLYMCVVY